MCYIFLVFLAFAQTAKPSTPDLNSIIDGVDRTFRRMSDFSADFVQIGQDSLNRTQQDQGHLYLMKPRMMRWEYKTPEEKLFVSNGKTVWSYIPADRQIRKDQARDVLDERMPLMFLVGRSNLRGEFTSFSTASASVKPKVEGTVVINMKPKKKTDLKDLMMEVEPGTFHIRRLALTYEDGSRSDFVFSSIRVNTGLRASLFEFKPPPGIPVLEGIGR